MSNSTTLEEMNDLMGAERWEEALGAASEALHGGSTDYRVLWNAGWACFKLDKHEDAIELLRRAVDVGPAKSFLYWSMSAPLMALKDYESAELWLLRALAIKDTAVARSTLALVYMKLDNDELAEAVHKEGIRLQPGDRERLESYADFLSDFARERESTEIQEKADALPQTEHASKASSIPANLLA